MIIPNIGRGSPAAGRTSGAVFGAPRCRLGMPRPDSTGRVGSVEEFMVIHRDSMVKKIGIYIKIYPKSKTLRTLEWP